MPLYTFRCPTCHGEFDRIRPYAQARESVTCACGAPAARLYLAPGTAGLADPTEGGKLKRLGEYPDHGEWFDA